MRCLVREVYAYLALVSNITPLGLGPSRHLPLDRLTVNLDRLEDTETYGCVLGCGHDVFECIREVAGFARTRLDEGNRRELCSTRSKSRYRTLLRRIGELRASDPPAIWDPAQARLARLARDMYCGSLRIFLETGMCGAVVDDPCALGTIQSCVDEYVANDAIVSTTAWGTIAVWPMMIAGSCMLKRAQQAKVCHDIWNTPLWRVNHVLTAERILKLLWLSEDKRVFGPFGLYLIMERHGIDMPMA